MLIGSQTTSTLLDVFRIGMEEIIRATGLPTEAEFKTHNCTIEVHGKDLNTRIDEMHIHFTPREDVSVPEVEEALNATRLGVRMRKTNGTISIQVPSFTWQQLPLLAPLDEVIDKYVIRSLRSETWELEVSDYVDNDFNINRLIEYMREKKASDLHLRAGNRPFIRVDNDLQPIENLAVISKADMERIVLQLGGEAELQLLERERESSFQYHAAGVGYLRCSGYIKGGAMAIALRLIPEQPLPFQALNIPDVVREVCDRPRGLFLVCGITGSGKSTTLAAMVDYINEQRRAHIITIEDPVEYVYVDKKSIVSQRQVGRDTHSFGNALRGSLREDPDVILVGEMRDMETIRAGLSAAETGHLVFSTLHTTTAVDTINRMISYFPQNERDLIRQESAYSLQGVVCQRLLKKIGGGRIPAVEILLGGRPIVRDAILDGDLD